MIISTTNNIEGREVEEYIGIIFGETVSSLGFLGAMGAGLMSTFKGRVSGYESEIISAREEAVEELKNRAISLGADAVIGCKMDYEILGESTVMMVTISGTAVKLKSY